jgi:hypothetical protein
MPRVWSAQVPRRLALVSELPKMTQSWTTMPANRDRSATASFAWSARPGAL